MTTKNRTQIGRSIPTTSASSRCGRTQVARPPPTRGTEDNQRESPTHRYNLRKRHRVCEPESENERSKKQRTTAVPETIRAKPSRLKRPRLDDPELGTEHSKKHKTTDTEETMHAQRSRRKCRLRSSQSSSPPGVLSPAAMGPPTPVHTPDQLSPRILPTTTVAPGTCGDLQAAQTPLVPPTTVQPSPPDEPVTAQTWTDEGRFFIEPLSKPKLYPRLPFLDNFQCTFVREIQTTDMASVLVVSMPDSSERILKLFSPDYKKVFLRELAAYCALAHHGISVPPTTAGKRIVPYCYGSLRLQSLRQLKRSTGWKSPMRKAKLPLCGLLLEFIPNATSIAADPARLAHKPHLVDDVVDALRLVHSAGVYHEDTMPRNMMLDEKDGVWWIDFGSASTTGFNRIDPIVFAGELREVERLLKNDVIPSEREGRTPEWHIMGW